ncbi:MAG: cysteine desulfurase [Moritella dasanensis]|jgi:cysteine desulfurase
MSNTLSGYFDYNATTPLFDSVMDKMAATMGHFSNASGKSVPSQKNKQLIQDSRQLVADLVGCGADQLAFVSGGSEANNWAIKGCLLQYAKSPGHIITSTIEHPSVLDTVKYMVDHFGFEVTFLKPNRDGAVSFDDIELSIRADTQLISLMYANNETGVIQPVKAVQKLAHDHGIKFHVDAVQIVGKRIINFNEIGADYISFSAHKFYGPKGIGGLYIKIPTSLPPLIHGGGQEMGMRAGTENLLAIAGMGQAAKECHQHLEQWELAYQGYKKSLIEQLSAQCFEVEFNGVTTPKEAMSNTLNFSIKGIRGEALALMLDRKYNISVSIGSACSNNKTQHLSHVLESMDLSEARIQAAIRMSFGYFTRQEDIDYFVDSISTAAIKLLSISSLD